MYPEDRVLVAVINRQRDLELAQHEHWYRVPAGQATHGIHAEYLAFYLSRAFGDRNGGIHFYARRTGMELLSRRDLLPAEPDHPRADARYHKLQLGEMRLKTPPVLNPTRRAVAFIYTTWDRFSQAEVLADLYDPADTFVDRVFHALERSGVHAERIRDEAGSGTLELRVDCQDGPLIAGPGAEGPGALRLEIGATDAALHSGVDEIRTAVQARGGPLKPAATQHQEE